MRVLVTGGLGFIGRWLCKGLKEQDHEVHSIDNLSGGFLHNRINGCHYYIVDAACNDAIDKLLSQIKPDIVYLNHSCAREGASVYQPRKVTKDNYFSYITIIENCIKHKVKKIIFASTMAIYGNQTPPFTENMPLKPVDIYGMNKATTENSLQALAKEYDFRWTIFRPHNVIGLYQSMSDVFRNVLGIFCNRKLRGEPLYVYGDGKQTRMFSPILNSLPCILKLMEESTDSQIYNIGGTVKITINELAQKVQSHFDGTRYNSRIMHLPDRSFEVKHAYCDPSKSIKHLDYKETQSLDDCIEAYCHWAYRQGPQEWTDEELSLESERTPKTWIKGELR